MPAPSIIICKIFSEIAPMRSATWITVLIGLFMFQSLWNVAAAFCMHDSNERAELIGHFGHHQNILCQNEDDDAKDSKLHQKYNNVLNQDHKANQSVSEDHHDHLPSMIHFILQQAHDAALKDRFVPLLLVEFFWQNLYQEPDLFINNPPPNYNSLLVG